MSLSNTLEKLLQHIKQTDTIHDDVEEIVHRAILNCEEMEATISELIAKVKTLERRERNLEEHITELEERLSELESRPLKLHEAS
ncbi:MAG: hypothetical protein NWE83_05910 [Candidatus Bathyarchaeota archaeon]|nr:hypothetical protein [Candidatus Bathyarchaeota archaeon]